jgi:hypothetical protein
MQQCSSQIRKGRVLHSNSARHDLLFWETLRSHTGVDADYAFYLVLRIFRWQVVPSLWAVGPEDEGKLTSR